MRSRSGAGVSEFGLGVALIILSLLVAGRTSEGKRFPLQVIVLSSVSGERRLLDLRCISDRATAPAAVVVMEPIPSVQPDRTLERTNELRYRQS